MLLSKKTSRNDVDKSSSAVAATCPAGNKLQHTIIAYTAVLTPRSVPPGDLHATIDLPAAQPAGHADAYQ
jgi:hypothetical protein